MKSFHLNPVTNSWRLCNWIFSCPFLTHCEIKPESRPANIKGVTLYSVFEEHFKAWDFSRVSKTILLQSSIVQTVKCARQHEITITPKRWFVNPICYVCFREAGAVSNHELALEWSLKNELAASEVRLTSKLPIVWECKSGHEFSQPPFYRFREHWSCPVCSKKKTVSGVNDLTVTHGGLLKEWDYQRNAVTPESLTSGSKTAVWWRCANNSSHGWEARPSDRVHLGSSCPKCPQSKFEEEVACVLKQLNSEFVRKDREVLAGKELDFIFPKLAVAFEVNGEYWHSDRFKGNAEVYHRDKMKRANHAGYALYFIWEDDWRLARSAVEEELKNVLIAHELDVSSCRNLFMSKYFSRLTSNRDL